MLFIIQLIQEYLAQCKKKKKTLVGIKQSRNCICMQLHKATKNKWLLIFFFASAYICIKKQRVTLCWQAFTAVDRNLSALEQRSLHVYTTSLSHAHEQKMSSFKYWIERMDMKWWWASETLRYTEPWRGSSQAFVILSHLMWPQFIMWFLQCKANTSVMKFLAVRSLATRCHQNSRNAPNK